MTHSEDVQQVVERTLRWVISAYRPLKIAELVEAIAIEVDDTTFDEYSTTEEVEILKWCSCLIRKTSFQDNDIVELAHFTVEEFLEAIDSKKTPRLARFADLKKTSQLYVSRTCLTYLNFDVFAKARVEDWFWLSAHPFWNYAAYGWQLHAARHLNDNTTKGLIQRFFQPSISPNFVIWNRYLWLYDNDLLSRNEFKDVEEAIERWKEQGFDRVDSISPLHQASNLALEEVVQWLVASGSDPNKPSFGGFPLENALVPGRDPSFQETKDDILKVITLLLDNGADPNRISSYGAHKDRTPLLSAVQLQSPKIIRKLLQSGASVDMKCVKLLKTMTRKSRKDKTEDLLPTFLEFVMDVPASVKPALMDLALDYDETAQKAFSMLEQSAMPITEDPELLNVVLREASLDGQLNVVLKTLPLVPKSIDSKSPKRGRTALHNASSNDHYDIVQTLLHHGASPNVQVRSF